MIEVEKSAFITSADKVTRVTAAGSGLLNIVLILRREKRYSPGSKVDLFRS